MTPFTPVATAATLFCAGLLFTTPAAAWCGAIEQSYSSPNVRTANARANHAVNRQLRRMWREHGKNLVLSQRQSACVGGAVSIDSTGNETVGPSRCTVTQPFCVNS